MLFDVVKTLEHQEFDCYNHAVAKPAQVNDREPSVAIACAFVGLPRIYSRNFSEKYYVQFVEVMLATLHRIITGSFS